MERTHLWDAQIQNKQKTMATVYDFKLTNKKGQEVSLADYKGKVLHLNMKSLKPFTVRIALKVLKYSTCLATNLVGKLQALMPRFLNSARSSLEWISLNLAKLK